MVCLNCLEEAGLKVGGSEHLALHGAFPPSLRAPGDRFPQQVWFSCCAVHGEILLTSCLVGWIPLREVPAEREASNELKASTMRAIVS